MENTTPMLKQYQSIKSKHRDCILFFRLGDFYEMFYDDAKQAAPLLDVVLTARSGGKAGKIPMCGIPFHAADSYIHKLIKNGLKVAICEQVEDPSASKGIVKRDVIRVITSGTFIDESTSDPKYLCSLNFGKKLTGFAFTDVSSGTISANEYPSIDKVLDIMAKLPVSECIYADKDRDALNTMLKNTSVRSRNITFSSFEDWSFNNEISYKSLCDHFKINNLRGFGLEDKTEAISASGALIEYMRKMNRMPMKHVNRLSLYSDDYYVFISPAACYGLELDNFVAHMDNTVTAFGKRLLRDWVYHPLKDISQIKERQNAVNFLLNDGSLSASLYKLFSRIPDISKSITRISCGLTRPKDLLALRNTLSLIPEIRNTLSHVERSSPYFYVPDIIELRQLLERSINSEMVLSRPQGDIIRKGFNAELDELKDIRENGREWLRELQSEEIKRTGINSLKIGFNKVFGYFITISKANLHLVPDDYIRKQTLVNQERYITPALKEFEEKMATAEDKILKIEGSLITDIQREILNNSEAVHTFINSLSSIDVLNSFCKTARNKGYIMPELHDGSEIIIEDGRHPVVENFTEQPFVPNETTLDREANHLIIITGPNMAGKSTFIRQTALLVIMAQMGSFIPAAYAKIGITDKIFTRIGAHDDITKGQSTFMVEMTETADILNNLTSRSLVILDEVGRGTSTYDGLSLAWAVAEYLAKAKVRALFATHFHEITSMSKNYEGVKNYNIAVKKWQDEIVFLHKIIPGGCDDSYGIYVAKLAGIPDEVLKRGSEILLNLELSGDIKKERMSSNKKKEHQLSLFNESIVKKDSLPASLIKEIEDTDIDSLKPVDALVKIQQWKEKISKNGKS